MKKNSLFALIVFIFFWVFSLLVLWILPINSKFGNFFEALVLIIVFVLIITFTSLVWYKLSKESLYKVKNRGISRKKILFIIYFSSISTYLGNLFVFFDRTVCRGIDYSKGFRNARYQWLNSVVPGSLISKFGNIMIPFSYCALFMGIFHWEILNMKQRIIAIAAGFGGQFVFGMLNGGRSNILLSIYFSVVVCVLRKASGKRLFPKIKYAILWIIVAFSALFSYVAAIFYWIADNDLSYLQALADMLGARVSDSYVSSPIINFIVECALYLFHGIYYISPVINCNPSFWSISDVNHNMSFRWFFTTLAKTPFLKNYSMELPEFDVGAGTFVAVPGILLYDYGYFGFIIGCIFFGILLGWTLKFLNTDVNGYGIIGLVVVIITLLNLYMSMITLAINFGYFMFMVFSLISMEIISSIIYGRSSWINYED